MNKIVLVLFDPSAMWTHSCQQNLHPSLPGSHIGLEWFVMETVQGQHIFCLGQSSMIANPLTNETDSAGVRTWAREVRLAWGMCRPSGRLWPSIGSWCKDPRGSHLNLRAPADTGGIKKAHRIYPIGGGQ